MQENFSLSCAAHAPLLYEEMCDWLCLSNVFKDDDYELAAKIVKVSETCKKKRNKIWKWRVNEFTFATSQSYSFYVIDVVCSHSVVMRNDIPQLHSNPFSFTALSLIVVM